MDNDLKPDPWWKGKHASVEMDGFSGTIIGEYTTLEGKHGWVIQLDGTKVVHVYGVGRVAVDHEEEK